MYDIDPNNPPSPYKSTTPSAVIGSSQNGNMNITGPGEWSSTRADGVTENHFGGDHTSYTMPTTATDLREARDYANYQNSLRNGDYQRATSYGMLSGQVGDGDLNRVYGQAQLYAPLQSGERVAASHDLTTLANTGLTNKSNETVTGMTNASRERVAAGEQKVQSEGNLLTHNLGVRQLGEGARQFNVKAPSEAAESAQRVAASRAAVNQGNVATEIANANAKVARAAQEQATQQQGALFKEGEVQVDAPYTGWLGTNFRNEKKTVHPQNIAPLVTAGYFNKPWWTGPGYNDPLLDQQLNQQQQAWEQAQRQQGMLGQGPRLQPPPSYGPKPDFYREAGTL